MKHRVTHHMLFAFVVASCLLGGGCSSKKDISGTWKGKITLLSTGKSLSDLEFSLLQKGTNVTGTIAFTKPGVKLPISGTVKEGNVSLTSLLNNGLAITITGTVENRKKITGSAVLDYNTPQLGKRQDKTVLELTR